VKIAYVVTRAEPIGGAQVHVRDFAHALRRLGHDPIVLTSGSGPYTEGLQAAGIQTISLPSLQAAIHPLRDLRALHELRTTLKQLKPDLVSAHSSKAGVLARMAARSLGIPVIFTAHGWAFTPGIPDHQAAVYTWIERLAAPLASKVITVSEFDRRLALARGVAASRKLVTIHNGMPDVGPELRAVPGRSPVRFTMVARFEPQKDHTTLLQAMAGLPAEGWSLDLIGDGPLQAKAEALCRSLGLSDRVRFWGQRLDVETRLAEAQVALLISNWEGFPRSILEAMRAGLPVIATAVGGVVESVINGETGFTVSRGDAAGLRQRLAQLLTDAELRTRLGRRARELYEERFTLERTLEKTLQVYREVMEDRG